MKRNVCCNVLVQFFALWFSRNMWQVKNYVVVPEQSHEHSINADKDISLFCVQSASRKRKCCAGSRIGPCFQTVISSPPPPFSWEEKPKREQLTGKGGGKSQHPDINSLTETFTLRLLYMRKKPIQKSAHTHKEPEIQTQASAPDKHTHTTLVRTFTNLTSSLSLSSSNSFMDENCGLKQTCIPAS